MRRILLDQGLAPRTAILLRDQGWDVVHVFEIGLDRAEDAEILDHARVMDRVCVTLDHDFHAHLALSRAGRPSVVLLRVEGLGADAQASLLESIWTHCATVLAEGAAVSASPSKVRIRRLPLR